MNNNLGGSSEGGGTEDTDTEGEPTDTTEEVYTTGGANEDGEDQGDSMLTMVTRYYRSWI